MGSRRRNNEHDRKHYIGIRGCKMNQRLYDNEFIYKDKKYMLCELYDTMSKNISSYDIMAIFECRPTNDGWMTYDEYIFVGYFYGTDATNDELIRAEKKYIDLNEQQTNIKRR